MKKEDNNLKEIDDYLAGELAPEHVAEFEKRIRLEYKLQTEVALTKQVIDGIKAAAFKEMLKKIHRENFGDPGVAK